MIIPACQSFPVRVVSVLPASICVTAILLIIMYQLIETDEEPVIIDVPQITPVVMPQRKIKTEEVKPEPPIEPAVEPSSPPFEAKFNESLFTTGELNIKPVIEKRPSIAKGSGMLFAYLKPAPKYPQRALRKGVEGFVDIMFDVTGAGVTQNIRILQSEPSGHFESATLKAVTRWKYKPQIIDGVSVPQYDIAERVVFEISQ